MAHITSAKKGTVYLVGAGPGDPELLTIRAGRLLATTDVVLHDDLVSKEVLALVNPQSLVINVGKRCGVKHITQEQIHGLMITSAQTGQSVVRLKSGDPMVFGRAGEEMDALREVAIPFEVVSGITAAFAAAAAAKRPLTDRRSAASVTISTGHRAELQEETSKHPDGETQAIYMPGKNFRLLAEAWLQRGESPALPCLVVSKASQPEQTIIQTTLEKLASLQPPAAPAVLLAGWALQESETEAEESPTPFKITDFDLSLLQIQISK